MKRPLILEVNDMSMPEPAYIPQWYQEQLRIINRAHLLALEGLKTELSKKQDQCDHDWVRYEELFYALGNTCPGMRCSKCIMERHLTDEEMYPTKGWKIPWRKKL